MKDSDVPQAEKDVVNESLVTQPAAASASLPSSSTSFGSSNNNNNNNTSLDSNKNNDDIKKVYDPLWDDDDSVTAAAASTVSHNQNHYHHHFIEEEEQEDDDEEAVLFAQPGAYSVISSRSRSAFSLLDHENHASSSHHSRQRRFSIGAESPTSPLTSSSPPNHHRRRHSHHVSFSPTSTSSPTVIMGSDSLIPGASNSTNGTTTRRSSSTHVLEAIIASQSANQQQNDDDNYSNNNHNLQQDETSSENNGTTTSKRQQLQTCCLSRRCFFGTIGLCILGITLIVFLVFLVQKQQQQQPPTSTLTMIPTTNFPNKDNNLNDELLCKHGSSLTVRANVLTQRRNGEENPFEQCRCFGTLFVSNKLRDFANHLAIQLKLNPLLMMMRDDGNNNNLVTMEAREEEEDDDNNDNHLVQLDCASHSMALAWMALSTLKSKIFYENRQLNRYILAWFFAEYNGHSWSNKTHWLSTTVNECQWHGVVCNDNTTFVHQLLLPSNNIKGNWTRETSKLLSRLGPQLSSLVFKDNKLNGNLHYLPLTLLKVVDFSENQLQGPIISSSFIQYRDTLRRLDLSRNNFSGSLHSDLFSKLTHLVHFNLYQNPKLGGSLTQNVGRLSQLESLRLDQTRITGTIPTELGLLSRLETLTLDESKLFGSLPSEMGRLTRLQQLFLPNEIMGTIPTTIRQLVRLKIFFCQNNALLTRFDLNHITNMTNLQKISLRNSRVSGTIPDTIGEFRNLATFDISGNENVIGTVPSEMASLPKLSKLLLDGTSLSGELAPEFCNIPQNRLTLYRPCQLECLCCTRACTPRQ